MQKPIIKLQKSVIPSCDVASLEKLKRLVNATHSVKGIGAYKIGFELVIPFGMKSVVETIRKLSDLPIIYDHQKAATDIPEMGDKFMRACKGVDAVILFPLAGPETEKAWLKAAQKAKMPVIVGGEMTHKGFLETEDGFIRSNSPERIYEIAAGMHVKDYVVPGNRLERIERYRLLLESRGVKPVFYSPGLIAQGGRITEAANVAGERWHAIVGRAIYEARDMKKAAKEMVGGL
ncbi:orotidine 5'-phosphate decarboxylase [Candidatus Woesearchaeota archaeon]|nr:orotidine 5'-phosphate decarboxylase [Candidatus Woesearchaeota archaeon]